MRRWSLSDLALDRPVTVGMALVAVLLLGLVGIAKMPLSFLPMHQMPRVFARVNITRTSPGVLERDVIRPIEEQIAGIRDLQRIQVGSGSWGVRINLDFDPGTDVDARKAEIRDRIERVRPDLPEFVQNIQIGSYTNFDDPVMEVRISSGTDLSEDYYLIEEHVVRPLERIPGVARVELDGVSPHELEVAVDLEEATRSRISLEELGATVRDARAGRSLGTLRGPQTSPGIRTPTHPADPERFAALPIQRDALERGEATMPAAGQPEQVAQTQASERELSFAPLGEVAKVSAHPEELRYANRLNGRKAITLEVFAAAGASTVSVSRAVQQTIAAMGDNASLDGIELLVEEDQGRVILQTLSDLRDTGIYGGLLGIAVLFLFLHRVRTTLAASVCIPLAVLAACAVLFLRGDELNCIVMLGLVIAIGMLIDNAVVIVEAISQHAQRGEPPLAAARLGAREVGFATIASTTSTVIVFLPLVMVDTTDPMTAFLRPLGITFAIALVCSLFVSQTAVPLLAGRLLPPRTKPVRHRALDAVARGYAWVIGHTLRHPRVAVLLGLVLAASAIWPGLALNVRLAGSETQPDNLPIRIQVAGSRSFEQLREIVMALEDALLEHESELGTRSVSCSYSDHWGNCRVYPAEPFESEHESEALKARVEAVLPELAGVKYRLGERQFDWRENQDRNVVEFAIRGEEMAELMGLAGDVADHLRRSLPKGDREQPEGGGYDTVTTPFDEGAKEIQVELDGERLRRVGLSADTVAARVSLAFQGLPLGTVQGDRGDLRLRLTASEHQDEGAGLAALRDLKIPVPGGTDVPLGTLGDVTIEGRPWFIQRVDRQTEVRLSVRLFSTDSAENWKVVGKVLDAFAFPPGYSWGRGTQWRRQREANVDWMVNLGLCLLLVYAVMASLFESFLQPLGILVTCLLGCFGAFWALWATGTTLDTTAVVGFFILIGIVVNNGIMLVDKITQLRRAGLSREAALTQAGRERLRPILMTVTTTVLGLVPMLIHHPTLAGVYYHAIAIVIAGGLVTSTFTTLVFLPATYTLIEGATVSSRRTFAAVMRWRR